MSSTDRKLLRAKEDYMLGIVAEQKRDLIKEVAHLYQRDAIDYETFIGLVEEIKSGLEYVEREIKFK